MTQLELSLERSVLSIAVLVAAAYSIDTASADHFSTLVGVFGPLMGAVVSWWFRLNGTAQVHTDATNAARATKQEVSS